MLDRKFKWIIVYFMIIISINFFGIERAYAEIVNPKQVYTYEQMEIDLAHLSKEYPDLITYKSIGKSEYGREIYAVSLGKGISTSYINASNHAREWISTNLVMKMIDSYALGYRNGSVLGAYNVKQILDNHTIWFVPMMNPDGVTLQQVGLHAFPTETHENLIKMNGGSFNFSRWKANGKGIDLNRQFDARWEFLKNGPAGPSYENFKGTAPHQASEIKAVIDFTYKVDPEMAVSYHSSGNVIFWNFLQQGSQYERDLYHARKLSQMTGYRLSGNHSSYSGGGYTDWFTDTFKKPAFTPELGTYVGLTDVPLAQFDKIWAENRLVGLYVANESHKMYLKELYANLKAVNLMFNGTPLINDVNAMIINQRTLVPVRGFFELLGASVKWNPNLRMVEVKRQDTVVQLFINSKIAFVNGEEVEMDVPAQIIFDRTMVPVRFISEAIGAQVRWEQISRTVFIDN